MSGVSTVALSVLLVAVGFGLDRPAHADGGRGAPISGVAGGAGGVDGTAADAAGKDGNFLPAANPGTGGGGGAVDLTTGFGAHGGARGIGGVSTGVGAVLGKPGTTGAAGAFYATATTVTTTIGGGTGGAGQAMADYTNTAGGGGGGGVGISTSADIVIGSGAIVTGGNGGGAGTGGNAGGGGGGVGLFSSANVTVAAGGRVTGGAGGGSATASAGGGGGMGVVLMSGGSLVNSGAITGGAGGSISILGSGGDGGAGVLLTAGGTITNLAGATITGGVGGNGRYNLIGPTRGGLGGAGVKGANISLVNAGTITGAMGGATTGGPAAVRAAAVQFTGGVNALEIWAGSVITGNVLAFGAADTLRLGGTTNAGFDVSQIGAAAQYRGFGMFEKVGASTWTLTGTTTAVTPWTLSSGVLQVSSDGNLGDPSGTLTFNGGTLRTTAALSLAAARAITLTSAGGTLDTNGVASTIAGTIGGSGPLTVTGGGSLTLSGANTYTGLTTIAAATTLALAGSGGIAASSEVHADGTFDISATTAGASIQTLSGSGGVNTGTQTLTLTHAASTFAGALQDSGGLTVAGGKEILTGNSSAFTGTTTVQGGTLAVNGVLGGALTVSGGRLQGIGTVGDTTNLAGGTIAPGNSIGTLTVAGNYIGNGGVLEIETVLGGDGSPADRLIVTGNTSGSTNVKVINLGGNGAPTADGIKVVGVGGASNGTFTLIGDYAFHGQQAVIGGAYAYTLQKNGVSTPTDGGWYLRSSLVNPPLSVPAGPIYQPGVPLYEAMPQVLLALNSLPTLQQRVGNRYWTDTPASALPATSGAAPQEASAFWGRIDGGYGRTSPNSASVSTLGIGQWTARSGLDMLAAQSDAGLLIGGFTVHHGWAQANIRSPYGDGQINARGYGFGATMTWYGANGVYVDGQAQATWFDNTLTSDLIARSLGSGVNGTGYALSAETGRRFSAGGPWALTPQAQLSYASVDARFIDSFGAPVQLGRADNLTGRLGLALDRQQSWRDDTGRLTRADVYGVANVYYSFLGGSRVTVAATDFTMTSARFTAGVGLGGTYAWHDGRYALYGEALVKTGFNSDYSVGGTAGLRVRW